MGYSNSSSEAAGTAAGGGATVASVTALEVSQAAQDVSIVISLIAYRNYRA